MITYDLKGKTALVTGGASGIGLACVTMLAQNGCKVAINHLADDARGPEQAERLRGLGFDVIAVPGNVGKAGECEAMVASAIQQLGRLDFLVANAGTPGTINTIPPKDLDAITEELFEAVVEVNMKGVFRCVKAAAPALKAEARSPCIARSRTASS